MNVTALSNSKVTEIPIFLFLFFPSSVYSPTLTTKKRCMRLFSKFGHFSLPGSCSSFLSPKASVGDENVSHKEKFPEDKTSSATCSTCFRLTNRRVLYIFKFPIIRSVCPLNSASSIAVKCSWEVCILRTMGQVPKTGISPLRSLHKGTGCRNKSLEVFTCGD